ncbi:MAG: esterase family protein [Cyclobacteriaceae bacterium]|nr:esterase family protein [Cyclobacteriaceae bacterium]
MPASHYHPEKLTDIHSKLLERDTVVEIFVPQGQRNPEHGYPLLILNDGQDSKAISLESTLEQLATQKSIPDVIVVAVHAGDRMQEYGVAAKPDFKKRGTKAKAYSRFIMTELIPYIEYRYPISRQPAERAIAGFSLGGLSAVDIGWHHDYFGRIGAFSGSFWWRKRDSASRFYSEHYDRIMHQQIRKGKYRPGLKFWFQTGLLDEQSDRNKNGVIDSIDDTLDLIAELVKKGYRPFHDIQYLELADGAHDLPTWGRALPEFLKWAFPSHAPQKV